LPTPRLLEVRGRRICSLLRFPTTVVPCVAAHISISWQVGCGAPRRVDATVGGGLALARAAPHHPPASMIADQRQIPVSVSPSDLIDRDLEQIREPILCGEHLPETRSITRPIVFRSILGTPRAYGLTRARLPTPSAAPRDRPRRLLSAANPADQVILDLDAVDANDCLPAASWLRAVPLPVCPWRRDGRGVRSRLSRR